MRKKQDLHRYQQDAIDYLFEHNDALALLPVGAGKSVIGWTAAQELMLDGHVKRPLVFAPMRVAAIVWPGERFEWEHLKDEPIVAWGGEPAAWEDSIWKTSRQLWGRRTSLESRLPGIPARIRARLGNETNPNVVNNAINAAVEKAEAELAAVVSEERRVNKEARRAEPPKALHVTSYENLLWLCELYEPGQSPFDLWIFDEIGRLKNPKSPRYKAVRKHTRDVPIVWGLNATPAPEGFEDLFSQVQIVTGPKLWGGSFHKWRQKYFAPADYMGYEWRLQIGARELLLADLNKVGFKVDEAQLSYQKTMEHSQIAVDLPLAARTAYEKMEKEMMLTLPEQPSIVAMSAASVSMKLRQITQGFIYDEDGKARIIHTEKQDALSDLIDSMGREPLLVAYEFTEDLEAIRKVWKNLPYLGQGISSAKAAQHVTDWNARKLPVLALHPFCLHPDTLVLTEYSGWKRLITVRADERVFDGVEFVSHDGCQLSGVRPVIDCLGILMTPDHLVLVADEWAKAEDVRNSGDLSRAARYAYTGNDPGTRALLQLRRNQDDAQAVCGQTQQPEAAVLRAVPGECVPPYDRHSPVSDMAGHAGAHRHARNQELRALRWARDYGRSCVAGLQKFLARHAGRLLRQPDARAQRRERTVQQKQLSMGHEYGTAGQQTEQPSDRVQRPEDAFGRVLPTGGRDARRDNTVFAKAPHRGRSDGGVLEIGLPAMAGKPQEVYDLVNCGPRRRFAVRNAAGDVFIVHNSAGHGLNLQQGGSHICWYTLPWPLESWLQTNGRIDRQGQTRACYSHSIVANGTIDKRVWEALVRKDVEQNDIIRSIRNVGVRP